MAQSTRMDRKSGKGGRTRGKDLQRGKDRRQETLDREKLRSRLEKKQREKARSKGRKQDQDAKGAQGFYTFIAMCWFGIMCGPSRWRTRVYRSSQSHKFPATKEFVLGNAAEVHTSLQKKLPGFEVLRQGSSLLGAGAQDVDFIVVSDRSSLSGVFSDVVRALKQTFRKFQLCQPGGNVYDNAGPHTYASKFIEVRDMKGEKLIDVLIVDRKHLPYLNSPVFWHEAYVCDASGTISYRPGVTGGYEPSQIIDLVNQGYCVKYEVSGEHTRRGDVDLEAIKLSIESRFQKAREKGYTLIPKEYLVTWKNRGYGYSISVSQDFIDMCEQSETDTDCLAPKVLVTPVRVDIPTESQVLSVRRRSSKKITIQRKSKFIRQESSDAKQHRRTVRRQSRTHHMMRQRERRCVLNC